jgi:hypothetical protein
VRIPARTLGALGLLLAASTALTACDTSPFAAKVNSDVIHQSSLDSQLSGWAANKPWVTAYDTQNSVSNGGTGTTVEGTGGSGTYSTAFSAGVLSRMISTSVFAQHLASTGSAADADIHVAARGVNEFEGQQLWTGFSPSVRDLLTQELADEAALITAPARSASLQQAYKTLQAYIFYSLCVQQATAFTKTEAQAISSSGNFTGAQVCYDQKALENQAPAFFAAVIQLSPGKVTAPVATTGGYEVAKLVSRSAPPLNDSVAKVVAIALGDTASANQVEAVLKKATVKVNPAYGTWSTDQVKPPTTGGA